MVTDGETMNLLSTITCPHCGFEKRETMPVDSCRIVYECSHCKAAVTPKKGDCCVFCSYGSRSCPSKQNENENTS